jgi:glycosyltransferase involved in cell wall biosynthesis
MLNIALTADPELPVPPRHYGGIERIVDTLVRGLVRRGHKVTLFANSESKSEGYLAPWPGRQSTPSLDTVRNAASLTSHLARGRFDIVHSFSRLAYLAPVLPARLPKLMSYQRAISPRTTAIANKMSLGSLQFTAISRWMLSKPLSGRWHVIPNCVSLSAYEFQPHPGPKLPLVFLGRIEKIKGPHLAIEVARRAEVPLIIAGNVPAGHEDFFRDHILPHLDNINVRYVGPVDDVQKNTLLGRARALLMPILWEEPFGIVMAEAMACGTPVLGLRRGAVPEIVEHGVTGFVCDDVEGLIKAVGFLSRIDRAACRGHVERNYAADVVVESYLKVYEGMVRTHRNLRV